jgi:hypothetical protein
MKRTTEKNYPKAINSTEKGGTFLCRILTEGVTNDPRIIILRGRFSTTYTEKNYPKAINSTGKGVTFLCRIRESFLSITPA